MDICRTCGKCCFSTEMSLSADDIELIEKHNSSSWKRDQFCFLNDDTFQLKNQDGHCIFLDPVTKFCHIYSYRPQGCRFYPLIFDVDKNQCVLDEDCPYRHEFYRHKPEYEKKSKELRKWVKNHLLKL